MELNIFKSLTKENKGNNIKDFMQELSNALNKEKNNNIKTEDKINNTTSKGPLIDQNRKEGHLYLVTEDRNGEIYLWDFTDKPEHEFKEIITSQELLEIAKEGVMLQYKNGKYELYSQYGYDMLEKEENIDEQ